MDLLDVTYANVATMDAGHGQVAYPPSALGVTYTAATLTAQPKARVIGFGASHGSNVQPTFNNVWAQGPGIMLDPMGGGLYRMQDPFIGADTPAAGPAGAILTRMCINYYTSGGTAPILASLLNLSSTPTTDWAPDGPLHYKLLVALKRFQDLGQTTGFDCDPNLLIFAYGPNELNNPPLWANAMNRLVADLRARHVMPKARLGLVLNAACGQQDQACPPVDNGGTTDASVYARMIFLLKQIEWLQQNPEDCFAIWLKDVLPPALYTGDVCHLNDRGASLVAGHAAGFLER